MHRNERGFFVGTVFRPTEEAALNNVDCQTLHSFTYTLSPEQREVFWLHVVGGIPINKTAEILETSLSAISTRLGMLKLKACDVWESAEGRSFRNDTDIYNPYPDNDLNPLA